MDDFSYISYLSDGAILKKIGSFIKSRRIAQHLTQDEVAEKAAISRSTLSLLERGENIALTNLLKVLRVLDALYVFDQFQEIRPISPMQLAKEDEAKWKKRASKSKKSPPKDDLGW
ncbi:helix-turn-helix domain-containing protein [Belliella kenyensis]|uniref:Helix-turn-helix domain-containing protein n=1 Tax=Belliella kenyensis TaxID=1472724 RepID=A0ABV8EIF3_9BACT|nr:helix-turn-helix transcriptional regulator [Belliella kenyensis]MCH7401229.1 helix-turn-helix domain-containing protein [Belliella kenyensis]MDN3602675.1 helix-turn-helix transcriptional regulator [Belliella kenyensis]